MDCGQQHGVSVLMWIYTDMCFAVLYIVFRKVVLLFRRIEYLLLLLYLIL